MLLSDGFPAGDVLDDDLPDDLLAVLVDDGLLLREGSANTGTGRIYRNYERIGRRTEIRVSEEGLTADGVSDVLELSFARWSPRDGGRAFVRLGFQEVNHIGGPGGITSNPTSKYVEEAVQGTGFRLSSWTFPVFNDLNSFGVRPLTFGRDLYAQEGDDPAAHVDLRRLNLQP